jgi:predicted HTH domain antitoxin
MATVQVHLPDDTFTVARRSPDEVEHEMRVALAVRWYAQGLVSQEMAAQIAGADRVAFLHALSEAGVSPFQETIDDIVKATRRD